MSTEIMTDRFTADRTYTEFFQEGHVEVSRSLDDEFRDWLSDYTGHDPDEVKRLDVRWSWENAETDGRPVTVATVCW